MKSVRAYLDTNVLMEFRDIREHAWEDFLGVDRVVLVIPHVVFEELQTLKDKPGLPRKKRERAGELIRRLERELFPSGTTPATVPLRDHVELAYDRQSPAPAIFSEYSLDSAQLDARLVAAAIAAKTNDDVCVVSGDAGPRLLARGAGLSVREPPEEWRIPPVPDEVEVENRRLKQELVVYQSAAPRLHLQLETGGNLLHHRLPKPRAEDDEEYVQSHVEALRGAYDLVDSSLSFRIEYAALGGAGPGEMARYKRDLEQFLSDAALVIPKAIRYRNRLDLYIPINLSIVNNGSKPAESVRVDLKFPALHSPEAAFPIEKRPTLPARPRQPRPMLDTIMGLSHLNSHAAMLAIAPTFRDLELGFGQISWEIDGTSASVEIGGLRHTDTAALPELFVRLPGYDQAKSFGITYQVHAHNLPMPESGTIHVKIEQGDSPSRLQLEQDEDPDEEPGPED